MKKATIIKKGAYQHYKGDNVDVIGTAFHSETLEEFVIYQHVSGKRKGEKYFWARPVKMFKEKVVRDFNKIPRFKKLKDIE